MQPIQQPISHFPPPSPGHLSRTTLIGIVAVVAVIIVVAAMAVILSRGGSNGNGNNGPDTDADGMPNDWETLNGFMTNDPTDAAQDADSDGLTNLQEYQTGTKPRDSDTDDDGVLDGADVDPFNNVKVTVEITWVEFIDNIDTNILLQDVRAGDPYFIVTIDGQRFKTAEPITVDVSSTALSVVFTLDVPDSKESISITIDLWDDDSSGYDDDHADISPTQSRGLTLTYFIKTNSWTGDVTSGTADGSGDGTQSTDDDDAAIAFNIHE
jgi:hypothetical protein